MSVGGRRAVVALLSAVGICGLLAFAASPVGASYFPPRCPTVTYHSVPSLHAERVCMNLGVPTHDTQPGTYLFVNPNAGGEGIYTDTGTLVWWRTRSSGSGEDHNMSVVNLWGKPYLAVWSGVMHPVKTSNGFHVNDGTVLLFNNHYQQVGSITAGGKFASNRIDMHEFRVTPQGDALIGIYRPVRRKIAGHDEYVIQYVVQKLSLVRERGGQIHTGKILFQWGTAKHIPLSASYWPNVGAGSAWDYFHGNSIAQDTDGNLIISARNTWTIYKINVRTGRIMWRVGGKGDSRLKKPWCYQHDVTPLGNNTYSVFDDGGAGYACVVHGSGHPGRALIVRVDPSKHPARVSLVRSYRHRPGIITEYLGSAQRLSNRHMVVDWGAFPEITEYSEDGRVLMDLSMSNYSYRGYRFAWDGRPTAPPDLAARLEKNGTRLWASWNGSTEVAEWRVLAGTTAKGLASLGAVIPKRGFETPIFITQRPPVVEVQALDASGRILGTSKPVSTMALDLPR